MSSRIRAVEYGWTGWSTPRFARSNFAKPYKNWEYARKLSIFYHL